MKNRKGGGRVGQGSAYMIAIQQQKQKIEDRDKKIDMILSESIFEIYS